MRVAEEGVWLPSGEALRAAHEGGGRSPRWGEGRGEVRIPDPGGGEGWVFEWEEVPYEAGPVDAREVGATWGYRLRGAGTYVVGRFVRGGVELCVEREVFSVRRRQPNGVETVSEDREARGGRWVNGSWLVDLLVDSELEIERRERPDPQRRVTDVEIVWERERGGWVLRIAESYTRTHPGDSECYEEETFRFGEGGERYEHAFTALDRWL